MDPVLGSLVGAALNPFAVFVIIGFATGEPDDGIDGLAASLPLCALGYGDFALFSTWK
jgi:hypothetical protein